MAVLKRDEFFNRLSGRLAGDTTDEGIAFLEDMTDTYNDLETRANANGDDWERKYKELDESWKKRYQSRFFSGGVTSSPAAETEGFDEEEEDKGETITVEDLFEEGKE